jgi:hypothetical protein
LPPKPKITPLVWMGRSRPKLAQAASKVSSGQASSAATQMPTNMPATAQSIASTMPTLLGSS